MYKRFRIIKKKREKKEREKRYQRDRKIEKGVIEQIAIIDR